MYLIKKISALLKSTLLQTAVTTRDAFLFFSDMGSDCELALHLSLSFQLYCKGGEQKAVLVKISKHL